MSPDKVQGIKVNIGEIKGHTFLEKYIDNILENYYADLNHSEFFLIEINILNVLIPATVKTEYTSLCVRVYSQNRKRAGWARRCPRGICQLGHSSKQVCSDIVCQQDIS